MTSAPKVHDIKEVLGSLDKDRYDVVLTTRTVPTNVRKTRDTENGRERHNFGTVIKVTVGLKVTIGRGSGLYAESVNKQSEAEHNPLAGEFKAQAPVWGQQEADSFLVSHGDDLYLPAVIDTSVKALVQYYSLKDNGELTPIADADIEPYLRLQQHAPETQNFNGQRVHFVKYKISSIAAMAIEDPAHPDIYTFI